MQFGGLFGIVCALLSKLNILFLIGTILGLLCHLICDDLDGYIARKRNMSSDAGAYFDLLTDILHITYLIIALSFAGIINFKISIFLVPVYALIIFTAMNYILYLKEFLFPRLGPIETHLFFIILCVGSMLLGIDPIIKTSIINLNFAEIAILLGGIPMYFEMIRLQIQLLRRLNLNGKRE